MSLRRGVGATVAGALAIGMSCLPAWGQFVISARSGLINYVEGRVLAGGEPVMTKAGSYPEIKEGSQLQTEEGRAEVLLNPGVFLRVGENSAVRMLSNHLADTRIEFVRGAAIIEPSERMNETENGASPVSVSYRDTIVHLRQNGVYRFDGEPAQLRVYAGEARVARGAETQVVGAGDLIALDNPGRAQEFDVSLSDSLRLWSRSRSAYVAAMHESAARRKKASGGSSSGAWPRMPIPVLSH